MATDRSAYIEGLRELARRLEAHPDAPIPHDGSGKYAAIYVFAESREQFAAAARCYGGRKLPDDSNGMVLVDGVPGLHLKVLPPQHGVCERVQTGTRVEVSYAVPDDVAEQYRVEREVPVYETRCPDSILARDQVADALADEAVS